MGHPEENGEQKIKSSLVFYIILDLYSVIHWVIIRSYQRQERVKLFFKLMVQILLLITTQ